jgi:hypothetical protein
MKELIMTPPSNTILEYVIVFALLVISCEGVGLDWQLMLIAMRDSMLLDFAPLRISLVR